MRARSVTAAKATRPKATRRTAERRPLPDIRHIVMPFAVTASAKPEHGETIGAFLERTRWATRGKRWHFKLPTVCVVNGQPVPQRYWRRRRIKTTDRVEFWSRPHGGNRIGAKQIAGIVALIALAAIAPWAAGAIGLTGLAASAFVAVVTMGGGLLVAALTRPKPGGQDAAGATNDQVEQLYSVAAQGNAARLMQPLPAQYGRVKSFPDFAIIPWSEFDGNDQYLNVLLAVSLGKVEYESVYIDDTILWNAVSGYNSAFGNVDIASYDPGQNVALFPVNVVQSSEVSGQELSQTPVGGFVANGAGTTANALAVDLVWPAGMFGIEGETGNMFAVGVAVIVEVRAVDAAGAPAGDWVTYATVPYQFKTRNPQRRTIKFTVPAGRYEVRVHRDTPASDAQWTGPTTGNTQKPKTELINNVVWAGLRAFIEGPSSFPVSTLAIRIKANSQLTQTSARKFGVLCTRKVNVWNTDTDTFVEQASRNPFWAVWDAATNTDYGAGRPPSKVDFQTLFDMATAADARGDKFDYRFSSAVSVPEALDTILRVSRARHRWSGDILTFVRDEWSDVPRMLLTDREIVRNSLNIDYALNPDDASDAVVLEYVDEAIWNFAEIQYPENSGEFTAVNPTRIRIDGIVNRDHAHREAGFYYLQSQLRRVNVKLDTEHDGRMLGFGSRVRVQTELPMSWGDSGVVVSRASNTLVVSPAPTWKVGTHYIAIRTKTGRQFGPVQCSQGVDAAHIVLNGTDLAAVEAAQSMTLADALDRQDGADEPSFDFGAGTSRARDCIVLTGRPSGDRVTLGLVVDNEAVHATDLGDVPLRPALPALLDARAPVIAGLYATFRQNVAEPILDASWFPASGAIFYRARVSYDEGETYVPIYEGIASQFSAVVDRAALRLEVQGVGVRHGAWASVDLDAPVIRIAPGTVDIDSLIAGLSDRVTNRLKAVADRMDEISQFVASKVAEQDANNWLDKKRVRTDLVSTSQRLNTALGEVETTLTASISEVQTVATDATTAIATLETNVTAAIDDVSASVSTVSTAVATVSGHLAASYAVKLDVNGHASGFRLLSDGTESFIGFAVDHFTIAAPGYGNIPVFEIGTSGGVAAITIKGNIIADGTILARSIAAGNVTATHVSTNEIIAHSANVASLTLGTRHLETESVVTYPESAAFDTDSGSSGSFLTHLSVTVSFTGYPGQDVTIEVNGSLSISNLSEVTCNYEWRVAVSGGAVLDRDTGRLQNSQARASFPCFLTVTATGSPQSLTIVLQSQHQVGFELTGFTLHRGNLQAKAILR